MYAQTEGSPAKIVRSAVIIYMKSDHQIDEVTGGRQPDWGQAVGGRSESVRGPFQPETTSQALSLIDWPVKHLGAVGAVSKDASWNLWGRAGGQGGDAGTLFRRLLHTVSCLESFQNQWVCKHSMLI